MPSTASPQRSKMDSISSGILVSEAAVRSLVKELLGSDTPAVVNELPYQDPHCPIDPSPEMDTSYRAYDQLYSVPIGTALVPHDRAEMEVALKTFLEQVPENDIPKLYHKIQRVFDEVAVEDDGAGEGIKMKVSTNKHPMTKNVEESLRREIYRLIEAEIAYSGPDFGGESDDDDEPLKRKRDINIADTSDPNAMTYPQVEKKRNELERKLAAASTPEEKRAAKKELAEFEALVASKGSTREMSHGEMNDYLGHTGVTGVKGEEFRTLEKMKFLANLDPKSRKKLMDTARNEYIDFLASSGDITDQEVADLRAHPSIVEELEGFRDWLDAYVWNDLEAADPVHYIPGKEYDAIRADKLAKGIEPAWPKGPKGEPVHKKGDWTDKQRAKAAAATRDREKERRKEKKEK